MTNRGPDRKPDPRKRNGNARRKIIKRLRAEGRPCHICGRPIDYSLPSGDPWCFEVDEIIPVSRGGNPLDYSNVDAAHRICNQRRGNRMPGDSGTTGLPVVRSKLWLFRCLENDPLLVGVWLQCLARAGLLPPSPSLLTCGFPEGWGVGPPAPLVAGPSAQGRFPPA